MHLHDCNGLYSHNRLLLWDILCRQTGCLLMHNKYIVCAVIFPCCNYQSSHCSDCDNPNDDLPISMLHVILNKSYHSHYLQKQEGLIWQFRRPQLVSTQEVKNTLLHTHSVSYLWCHPCISSNCCSQLSSVFQTPSWSQVTYLRSVRSSDYVLNVINFTPRTLPSFIIDGRGLVTRLKCGILGNQFANINE